MYISSLHPVWLRGCWSTYVMFLSIHWVRPIQYVYGLLWFGWDFVVLWFLAFPWDLFTLNVQDCFMKMMGNFDKFWNGFYKKKSINNLQFDVLMHSKYKIVYLVKLCLYNVLISNFQEILGIYLFKANKIVSRKKCINTHHVNFLHQARLNMCYSIYATFFSTSVWHDQLYHNIWYSNTVTEVVHILDFKLINYTISHHWGGVMMCLFSVFRKIHNVV